MPLLLVIVFIVVPVLELWVILEVGKAIGAPLTIAILIVDSIVGSWLLRQQGRAAWRRFRLALAESRVPAGEVLDGAMIIFGGAFLITPGFITDIIGLILLLPPTRAAIRRALVGHFSRRFVVRGLGAAARRHSGGPSPGGRGRRSEPPPYDVEGDAADVDPPHLSR